MKPKRATCRRFVNELTALCILVTLPAWAQEIDLADGPLVLLQGVAPNLVVTIDDSASMGQAFLPDSIGGVCNPGAPCEVTSLRIKSNDFNPMHFDPNVSYDPPLYGDESLPLPNADFNNACLNAFDYYDAATGQVDCPGSCALDLAAEYRSPYDESGSRQSQTGTVALCGWESATSGRDPVTDASCDLDPLTAGEGRLNPSPPVGVDCSASAFYYRVNAACRAQITEVDPRPACLEVDVNYERVNVGLAEEQNFANWFVYYRNRLLLVKTAMSRAMAAVDTETRVGYQGLYSAYGASLGWPDLDFNGPTPFADTDRSDFFDWLFGLQAEKRATLHESLVRVGEELSAPDAYRDDPSDAGSQVRACRRNYQLVFVDGAWNVPVSGQTLWDDLIGGGFLTEIPEAAADNWDAQSPPGADVDPDGYLPAAPYEDQNTGSLADVAFYYWSRDLCTDADCENILLPVERERRDLDGVGGVSDEENYLNPRNNPATWQHLVTYAVRLNEDGYIPFTDSGFPDSLFTTPNIWSATEQFDMTTAASVPSSAVRSDDIWHTAINGRGAYFRVMDSQELIDGFESALADVDTVNRRGGSVALGLNSGSRLAGNKLYQASFDSTLWSGELAATEISLGTDDPDTGEDESCGNRPRGEVCPGFAWQASDQLNTLAAAGNRKMVTYDPEARAGTPFLWGSLSAAQQAALQLPAETDTVLAEARVEYLRGDHSAEARNGGAFRDRVSRDGEEFVLADIVNSAPLPIGPPQRQFTEASYRTFVDDKSGRREMVYVGANDGALHAFDADSGAEVFAYVPGLLVDELAELTEPDYLHRPYVDGPLAEGDVQIGGAWQTLLVGALGKGAQGLFALDVTDPPDVVTSEAIIAGLLEWEFGDDDDPDTALTEGDRDLGYVYGRPAIARIPDSSNSGCTDGDPDTACPNRWVVAVGNGYNNTRTGGTEVPDPGSCLDENNLEGTVSCSGNAVLFLLDVADGDIVKKYDTGVGAAEDPTSGGRPNGLADPVVVDGDGDLVGDFAYAGDLFGNLWKFDLTDLSGAPLKLFTAQDQSGVNQPVTSAVAVARHPTGVGTLVLFGTGQFLGLTDVDDTSVQTFYAVWDKDVAVGAAAGLRSTAQGGNDKLLQQSFLAAGVQQVTDENGQVVSEARLTTNLTIDWSVNLGWYIDLDFEDGERVVVAPALRQNRVLFVTLTPSGDPCASGGTSWVNALDVKDGSRLSVSPFDFDLNSTFGASDLFTVDGEPAPIAGSSIRLVNDGVTGVYSSPATLALEGGETLSYVATSSGEVITLRESSALRWRAWQEVQ